MAYTKNWIKEGMEVAHKENLIQKMFVRRILRQSRNSLNEKGEKIERSFVIGIEVHYWSVDATGAKVMIKEKYHTRELVPWEVAEGGFMATLEFFDNINKN